MNLLKFRVFVVIALIYAVAISAAVQGEILLLSDNWMWDDYSIKSYYWREPVTHFHWVRENRDWMFKIESGVAA